MASMTKYEVCRYFGINERTLSLWVHSTILPRHYSRCNGTYFLRGEVESLYLKLKRDSDLRFTREGILSVLNPYNPGKRLVSGVLQLLLINHRIVRGHDVADGVHRILSNLNRCLDEALR